jgi:hypothetical protein
MRVGQNELRVGQKTVLFRSLNTYKRREQKNEKVRCFASSHRRGSSSVCCYQMNGGQKSDFRQFHKIHQCKERILLLLFQLLKSQRLLAQPWLNGG